MDEVFLAVGESSTTKTLIIEPPPSDQPLYHFKKVALVEAALHNVGVRTGIDAPLPVRARIEPGDEDDREPGQSLVRPDFRRKLETVHPRHIDIGHHKVERSRFQKCVCIDAVDCGRTSYPAASRIFLRRVLAVTESSTTRSDLLPSAGATGGPERCFRTPHSGFHEIGTLRTATTLPAPRRGRQ